VGPVGDRVSGVAVVAMVAVLLAMTGCSDAKGSGSAVPTNAATAPTGSASTTTAIVTDRSGHIGFTTPSRNIGCVIEDDRQLAPRARCDIHDHTWRPPPRPKACDLDWGGGLEVGAVGKGGFTCASDAAFVNGPVLRYGHGYREGRFTCISRETGVTCTDDQTGHGFFISRESARLF
jgi:hypothetical protein